MEEKRTLKTKCEIACRVIAGLSMYAGLITWAACGSYLTMILIAGAAGLAATILEAGGD